MKQLPSISERLRLVTELCCIAVLTIGLTGCAKIKTRPLPVVKNGYWNTPDRKIQFKHADKGKTSERFSISSGDPNQPYLIAEHKKQGVALSPIQYGPIFLFGGRRDQIVVIQADQAFYEIFKPGESIWTPRVNLALSVEETFKCHISEKPCLMNFGAPFLGDILKAHPLYGYRIRYHIPYSTEGQDFLIDVTLEFKKDKFIDWTDWHFPGSP